MTTHTKHSSTPASNLVTHMTGIIVGNTKVPFVMMPFTFNFVADATITTIAVTKLDHPGRHRMRIRLGPGSIGVDCTIAPSPLTKTAFTI